MDFNSNSKTPGLSVVVVLLKGKNYLTRCLKALCNQEDISNIEVLVPYDETYKQISALSAEFPNVQFIQVQGYHTFAELRMIGIHQSRGAIVALTEDHAIPDIHWCAEIVTAHNTLSHAAIGGAVEKYTPDTTLNWSLYLIDYVRYMNPVSEGPAHTLTDCNVSYKRAMLDKVANVWQHEFHEPDVHGVFQAQGELLWLSPKIVIHQQRGLSFKEAVRDRYIFGRLFGSGRALTEPLHRRLLYAVLALPLPFILIARVAGHVFRKRRHIGAFIWALPFVTLMCLIWVWGEFVGNLTSQAEATLTPEHSVQTVHQEQ